MRLQDSPLMKAVQPLLLEVFNNLMSRLYGPFLATTDAVGILTMTFCPHSVMSCCSQESESNLHTLHSLHSTWAWIARPSFVLRSMDVAAAALWGSQTHVAEVQHCFILVAIWAADYSFDFEWTWCVRTGALRIFLRGCCRHDMVRVWGIWLTGDSSCSKEAVCGPFGVKMVFPPRRVREWVWFVLGSCNSQLHVKLSLDGKILHLLGGRILNMHKLAAHLE